MAIQISKFLYLYLLYIYNVSHTGMGFFKKKKGVTEYLLCAVLPDPSLYLSNFPLAAYLSMSDFSASGLSAPPLREFTFSLSCFCRRVSHEELWVVRLFAARICSHLLRSLSEGLDWEDSAIEEGSISCKPGIEHHKVQRRI